MSAFYSKEVVLYGGYLNQNEVIENAATAQMVLEVATGLAGFCISKGIMKFGSKGIQGATKSAVNKVYSAGGDAALRATRRPAFDNILKTGVKVNGNTFKLNEHAYNSMFKSGRKDIIPNDIIDALVTKPQPAQLGSV